MAVRQPAAPKAPPRRVPLPHDHPRRPERLIVLVAASLSVLVPLLQVTGAALPGRAVLALLFVVLAPGAPLSALLRIRSLPLLLAVSFSASMGLLLLLSTALVVIPFWHPLLATLAMSGTCLAATPPALRLLATEPPRSSLADVDLRERTVGLLGAAVSLALWLVAVLTTDLDRLGSLGLFDVVGPAYWLGLVVLVVVAVRQLRRAVPDPVVLSIVLIAAVVEMYGFINAADSGATQSVSYLHVGFVQYILDNHHVAHFYDARFSWPAFFAAGGVLVEQGGTGTALTFLRPAPIVNVLLCLPGLWSIAKTVSGRDEIAWLSLLTFLSLDWYGQDYFSPQATVYVLYIGVLAMVLSHAPTARQLVGRDAPWRHPLSGLTSTVARDGSASTRLVLGREAMLLLICSAVVVGHQLTPLNLLLILVVLVITGATRMRGLWLLVTLAFIAWFTFGASEYWRGNIGHIFSDIGKIGSTVNSAVGNRLVGDPIHAKLQTVRLAWSAGSVLVALVGLWRLRSSTWFWTLVGLTLGPFSLVVVQSYGGEVALRCFLYAEPLLAPLVAMTVWWALSALPGRTRAVALGAALLLGFTMLTVTRGANAAFERGRSADVAASRYLFAHVPPGAERESIGTLGSVGFAGYASVTTWTAVSLSPEDCLPANVEPCVENSAPDFLLVTPTMDNLGVLTGGLTPGWTGAVVRELVAKGLYKAVFTDRGDVVLQRVVS